MQNSASFKHNFALSNFNYSATDSLSHYQKENNESQSCTQGEKYGIRIPYDSIEFHRRFSRIP
jgi:hypothetical protein